MPIQINAASRLQAARQSLSPELEAVKNAFEGILGKCRVRETKDRSTGNPSSTTLVFKNDLGELEISESVAKNKTSFGAICVVKKTNIDVEVLAQPSLKRLLNGVATEVLKEVKAIQDDIKVSRRSLSHDEKYLADLQKELDEMSSDLSNTSDKKEQRDLKDGMRATKQNMSSYSKSIPKDTKECEDKEALVEKLTDLADAVKSLKV